MAGGRYDFALTVRCLVGCLSTLIALSGAVARGQAIPSGPMFDYTPQNAPVRQPKSYRPPKNPQPAKTPAASQNNPPAGQAPAPQSNPAANSAATPAVGSPTGPRAAPLLPNLPQVGDVKIEGNRSVTDQKILAVIKTRPGRPLDRTQVDEDVRRLLKTHLFINVEPRYERTPEGVLLVVFRVVERPTIRHVKVLGTDKSKTTLAKHHGLKVGDPLDPYAVDEGRSKLETWYHAKAYSQATVNTIEGDKPGDRGVTFVVNEGMKQKVHSVIFEGNTIAEDNRMRTQVQSKKPILWMFKGELNYDVVNEDVQRLIDYYRGLGFFRARVGRELLFNEKQNWCDIHFVVDEGPRYVVQNISIVGNTKIQESELREKLTLAAGEFFDQAKMNKDISSLQDKYGDIGFVFADVQAQPRFDEQPGKLDLVYKVEEGSKYRIGRITVSIGGDNPHTRQTAVYNRLSLRTGDIASTKKMRDSERRLKLSSIFVSDPQSGKAPKIVFRKPGAEEEESDDMIARRPSRGKKGPGVTMGGPGGGGMGGGGGGMGGGGGGGGYRGQSPDPLPVVQGEPSDDAPIEDMEIELIPIGDGPRPTTVARPVTGIDPKSVIRFQSPAWQPQYPGAAPQPEYGQQALGRTGPDTAGAGSRAATPSAVPPAGSNYAGLTAAASAPSAGAAPAAIQQAQYAEPAPGAAYLRPGAAASGVYSAPAAPAGAYPPATNPATTYPQTTYPAAQQYGGQPVAPVAPQYRATTAPAAAPYAQNVAQPAPAQYGAAPPPQYGAPVQPQYGAPAQPLYGAAAQPQQYGAPAQSPYGAPPQPAYGGAVARPASQPGSGYRGPEELFPQNGTPPPPVGQNFDPSGGSPLFNPDVEPIQDIPVEAIVNETQTGRLMLGVGVNSNSGLVGNAVIDEQNFSLSRWPRSWEDIRNATAFRGAGQQFRIEAAPGTQFSRYAINFHNPYLGNTPISFGISGSFFTRLYQDWTEQRAGGRVAMGYQFLFDPNLSIVGSFRAENVNISNPIPNAPQQLTSVVGNNTFLSGMVQLVHDTRNNAFLPTQGHRVSVGLEEGFGSYTFPRATIDASQFFLLRERPDTSGRHTLMLSTQLGFSGVNTPIYENYFAGGYTTLRGFYFRGASPTIGGVQVGGRFEFINSVEYMFPITADDMLRAVVFTDFGTVEQNITITGQDFRVAPGFGFRINIPAMGPAPIALDFAVPVHKAPGDREQLFSFFIGLSR
jgi:outer membrane protein insertion porin family